LDGNYVLHAGNRVGFQVAAYDRTRPLIIDPVLSYSTYLGGSGFDYAYAVAVDGSGNAYLAGKADSLDFPASGGYQPSPGGGTCGSDLDIFPCFDAFLTKLAPSGSSVVYSTYLGGSNDDFATGVAVDPLGNAFITGYTKSVDFVVLHALQAAYSGGNCGSTTNPDPCFDSFVVKINSAGTGLVYSTYLGGSGDDLATGIAVDASGNAVVTGMTSSIDFPTTVGALQTGYAGGTLDAFATKLTATGLTAVYSTFLGGSGEDRGLAVAVDLSGNAFVAGSTASTNFPHSGGFQKANAGGTCGSIVTPAPCTDAFVAKLNTLGTSLGYASYLGGTGGESANAITVDAGGAAYIAGLTTSADFPTTPGALSRAGGGTSVDAFVSKFSAAGSALQYATYLGGIGYENAFGIAVDSAGHAFVTGEVNDSAFPVASPVQASSGGFNDAFLTKLNSVGSAVFFSSFLGGSGNETGRGIALDSSGNAIIAGGSFSTDLPSASAYQPAYGGGSFDAFAAKFSNLALPVLTLSKSSVIFAGQGVGTTSPPQTVGLKNNGDAALAIANISVTGDFAQTNDCGASLATGATCTLSITSSPSELGPRSGAVTITDNAWGNPHTINLAGNGVPSPVVSLSPSSLSFPTQLVGSPSTPKSLNLANTGSVKLEITGFTTLGDFAQTNNCGTSVLAGGNCTIQVVFNPSAAGGAGGQVSISDNAPGSPHVVTLSGTGTGPAISLSAGELSFGNQRVGVASGARNLTLSSTGIIALGISGIAASGDFTETNNCPSSLNPGLSCTISVVFRPATTGLRSGTISILDNASASPHSVALSGAGIAPHVLLSRSELSFADQGVSTASAAQILTLSNTGSVALALAGVSVSGDFIQTNNCGTSLAQGASCAIQVRFTPSLMAARAGVLTIRDDAPDSPQTVSLSGNGVAAFFLTSATQDAKVVMGTDSVGFEVGASSPFAFAGEIDLSCDGGAPVDCSFTPKTIKPGGKSFLSVANLSKSQPGRLKFAAEGNAENQKSRLALSVSIIDFSLRADIPSLTVVRGGSGTFQIGIGSVSGFDKSVSLACSGLPANSACSIAPSVVTPGETGFASASVTVTTTTGAGFVPDSGGREKRDWPFNEPRWYLFPLGLLVLSLSMKSAGYRFRRAPALVGIILLAFVSAGCGGGGGSAPAARVSGTPPGSYNLKISGATQDLVHSVTVRLVVK
jgi:Beta-propeller repeat